MHKPEIRIVLCPVDFSDLSRRELGLAVEVCQAFGARLVLHHNLDVAPPGLSRVWEWNELGRDGTISEAEAEQRLREVLAELPASIMAEASLSRGPTSVVLAEMAKRLPADLLVLGSHGRSSADHASLTERMIDASACPVLTVEEGAHVDHFRLRPDGGGRTVVVVPTDLSPAAERVFDYAIGLTAAAPLDLHLLHILPASVRPPAVDQARRRLETSAAERGATGTVCHVERGEPVETILRCCEQLNAGFMVMGEHARGLLLRLFIRDVARAVLHRACCPVWFVPATA